MLSVLMAALLMQAATAPIPVTITDGTGTVTINIRLQLDLRTGAVVTPPVVVPPVVLPKPEPIPAPEVSTRWDIAVPEPPIPTVAAGESFKSAFGYTVTRLTDSGACSHYYVDRSPLNRDSTWIVLSCGGGSLSVMPIRDGKPAGLLRALYSIPGVPGSITSVPMWSKASASTLYVTTGTQVYAVDVAASRAVMLYDFAEDLAGLGDGVLKIQFVSADDRRMLLDHGASKVTDGVIRIDEFGQKTFKGRNMTDPRPRPNDSFALAGVGGATSNGGYVVLQLNGQPRGEPPLGSASSFAYVVPWGGDLLGSGYSISGLFGIAHGAMSTWGNYRVAGDEAGLYMLQSSGVPDWLATIRYTDFRATFDGLTDWARPPWRDVFAWPQSSSRMTGVHLSGSGPGDLALSLYQEGSCLDRSTAPLANEIIMISRDGTVEAVTASLGGPVTLKQNGSIHRITHHYSYPEDCAKPVPYWGAPRAAVSMDGRYVVFTSTFGRTGRQDVFLASIN